MEIKKIQDVWGVPPLVENKPSKNKQALRDKASEMASNSLKPLSENMYDIDLPTLTV